MDSVQLNISDRMYRIIWMKGPPAYKYLAAGEKILLIL